MKIVQHQQIQAFMNYTIEHKEHLEKFFSPKQIESKINQFINKAQQYVGGYSKSLTLEIFIKPDGDAFQLTFEIDLKSHTVYVSRTGENLALMFDLLKENFLRAIKKTVHKERLKQRATKRAMVLLDQENLSNQLSRSSINKDKECFVASLNNLYSILRRQIEKKIRKAEMNQQLDSFQYSVDDILDEAYLQVYEKFHSYEFDQKDIQAALCKEIDDLLIEKIKETKEEHQSILHLDELVKYEDLKMEEKIGVDLEGNNQLITEFDGPECYNQIHHEDIFSEQESDIIDQIDASFRRHDLKKIIDIELSKLRLTEHTIYDLYTIDHIPIKELAKVYNYTDTVVSKIIIGVNTHLKHVFTEQLSR